MLVSQSVSFCVMITVERRCWDGYSRKKDAGMVTVERKILG